MKKVLYFLCTVSIILSICACQSNPQLQVVKPKVDEETINKTNTDIPNFGLKYFLNSLNSNELSTLYTIYNSALDFEKEIKISQNLSSDDIFDIIEIMVYECPELFHVSLADGTAISVNPDTEYVESIMLNYIMTEAEYAESRKACEGIIYQLKSDAAHMTEFEKEKLAFDYIASRCVYDTNTKNAGNAYGVLIEKIGKCDGFSLALKWILEEMGIQCLVVAGDGSPIGHAWNIVRIDGEYAIVDLTESIPKSGETSNLNFGTVYTSFNVSDESILSRFSLHNAFSRFVKAPRCNSMSNSYYMKNGRFVASGEDYVAALRSALTDAKYNTLSRTDIQFENQNALDNVINNMNTYVYDWVKESGLTDFSYSYGVQNNVLIIFPEFE
nr:hypothetical protein [Clostridia bacterium]